MIQQTNDGLADLVTLIHRIFQCVNCSSITKQELVHKIIMNNLDIVERSMCYGSFSTSIFYCTCKMLVVNEFAYPLCRRS